MKKKTIRKIAAIATGALMVAAALPAAVADPWGYITAGGAWGAPQIVVGADAAAMDVAGAINMAGAIGNEPGWWWSLGVLDTEATAPDTLSSPVVLVGSNYPPAGKTVPANRLVQQLVDDGKWKELGDRGAASLTDTRDGVVEIVNDAFRTGQQAIVVAGVGRQGTRMASMQAASELIPTPPVGTPRLYTTTGTQLGVPNGIEDDIASFLLGAGVVAPTEPGDICASGAEAVRFARQYASVTRVDVWIDTTTVVPRENMADVEDVIVAYIKKQIPTATTVNVNIVNAGGATVRTRVNNDPAKDSGVIGIPYVAGGQIDWVQSQLLDMVTNRFTSVNQWGWIPPSSKARQARYNAIFFDTTAGRAEMTRAAGMLGILKDLKAANMYTATTAGAVCEENLSYADLYSLVFDVRTPTITPGTIIIGP